MRYLLLAVLILICIWVNARADDLSIWIGMGQNASATSNHYKWEDNGEAGCAFGIDYSKQIAGQWYWDLSASHFSQCMSGSPVNNDHESSAEFYYIKLRYHL